MEIVSDSERVYYRFEEVPPGGNEVPMPYGHGFSQEVLPGELPVTLPKPGFWKRQFGPEVTVGQRRFDWAVGVALPLICFLFDPFVFKVKAGDALLENYRFAAYMLAFVSISAMTAWLFWGERLRWLNGWLAGLFFVGSGISLIVGAILFPFSLLGILVLIGFLGFTPLFTSIVYLRNGVRALRASSRVTEKVVSINIAVLSGMIAIAVPYLAQGWLR